MRELVSLRVSRAHFAVIIYRGGLIVRIIAIGRLRARITPSRRDFYPTCVFTAALRIRNGATVLAVRIYI